MPTTLTRRRSFCCSHHSVRPHAALTGLRAEELTAISSLVAAPGAGALTLLVAMHRLKLWLGWTATAVTQAEPAARAAPGPTARTSQGQRPQRSAARRATALFNLHDDSSDPTDSGESDAASGEDDFDDANAGDADDADDHDDYCAVCDAGGEVLMCDACPRVYHLACHDPPLRQTPPFGWICSACVRPPFPTRARSAHVDAADRWAPPAGNNGVTALKQ